ncbi:SRPBCC domain-containing protein [Streptomyces sp. CB09001]|uniref:SRPBCC domain-containing protein n=1 Tax=Streptomyces sp. CB09001 TaxID=2083284 RepID=UPI000E20CA84|nr:SRPBCC domain-containing protein [Streptomyces sp. CB09001]AXL92979.1 SRPBCC domain-containing protein [Streptomyces sp. CB09001]
MSVTSSASAGPPAASPAPAPYAPWRGVPRRRRRSRILSVLAGFVAVLGGYAVWAHTHPVRLTASVEIEATPGQVWAVLTDFGAYPRWNPFVTEAAVTSGGGLRAGATMRNRLEQKGETSTFTPTVLEASAGRELRWLGRVGPGWIADGEHRFVIERTARGTVRLTQSEKLSGVAVPFVAGSLRTDTLSQFRAMNGALKERVERLAAR